MKFELTSENHFKFGYNSEPFCFRAKPDDKWFVEYGVCKRPPLPFRQECIETAKLIRKKASGNLHVMFSGGVDSEVALRSFVDAGIEVNAAIMRFHNDLNLHDIQWAIKTCEKLKVPYKFYDLDLLHLWNSEYQHYSDPTYCISPQLLPTMWLADQIKGYAIMGSGECFLARTDAPDPAAPPRAEYPEAEWELFEREKIAAWYRHFMLRNKSACPGFFQYTPEIMLSYLIDPYVQNLCTNKMFGKYTTASSKLKIYQNHFPDLETRPKYTGYENVIVEDQNLRKKLFEKYTGANEIHKSNYKELVQHLNGA